MAEKAKKNSKRRAIELERFAELELIDAELRLEIGQNLAGVDEAGRGPLAGPVVAAACILDPERPIYGLNDSKKLSAKKRASLYQEIIDSALAFSIAAVPASRIDQINILEATKEAMIEAVQGLKVEPDCLLIDAVRIKLDLPQRALIQGDAKSNSIAAASILAKESRDQLMTAYDEIYPGYNFAKHKGYGTKEHREKLSEVGPSPIHRLSFLRKFAFGEKREESSLESLGSRAEKSVAEHLIKQGYRLLERNFALANFGEIDLIMQRGEQIEIIEVKARKNEAEAWDFGWNIDQKKRSRLARLGEYYCLSRGHDKLRRRLLGALCTVDSTGAVKQINFVELD
ncbi:MAG: ribonuclease HII [Eubacteriales bacterium]|nr:ribonuclease HII [Eubacteriales bacterium]